MSTLSITFRHWAIWLILQYILYIYRYSSPHMAKSRLLFASIISFEEYCFSLSFKIRNNNKKTAQYCKSNTYGGKKTKWKEPFEKRHSSACVQFIMATQYLLCLLRTFSVVLDRFLTRVGKHTVYACAGEWTICLLMRKVYNIHSLAHSQHNWWSKMFQTNPLFVVERFCQRRCGRGTTQQQQQISYPGQKRHFH